MRAQVTVYTSILLGIFLVASPCLGKTKSTRAQDAKAKEETPDERDERLKGGYAGLLEVGFPHPLEIGFGWIQPKGDSHFGSFGLIQKNLAAGQGVRDIKVSMEHIEYRYRSEPWERHPLFWQLAAGYQQIEIDGVRKVNVSQNDINFSTDIQGKLVIRSLYYTPKVGVTKHFKSGLTLSWGFGYLIPALVTSDFSSQVPGDPLLDELLGQLGSYRDTKRDLEKIGKRVGQVGIPHVDILELVWRL